MPLSGEYPDYGMPDTRKHVETVTLPTSGAQLASVNCSANRAPEDIAKEWLDKHWESSGPKAQWPEQAWDKYHAQLGLLICFLDDCWPNGPDEQPRN